MTAAASTGPAVELFGPGHLMMMALTLGGAIGLSAWLRRSEDPRVEIGVRWGLALLLVVMLVLDVVWVLDNRERTVWEFIPLHLCDISTYLALVGLATRNRRVAEQLYFWTCSGTVLAMVMPAVETGFPSLRFFIYFSLHGGVVIVAVVLIFGLRLYLEPGAIWRAFAVTLAYLAAIAVVDALSGFNYLYLLGKPDQATLLDYMGPWPVYIIVALGIGLALFHLLELPVRRFEAWERGRA